MICTTSILNSIVKINVIDESDNFSNHFQLIASVETSVFQGKTILDNNDLNRETASFGQPLWKSVSADDIRNYQDFLWQSFADISFPVHLARCPSSCDSHDHREQLEGYLSNIVCLMHSAAYHCLPLKYQCQSKKSAINGWNQYVRPYQVAARQSFGQWAASGKPTSGPVYEVMKNDKKRYKYAVKRLKRHTEEIRLDRIACHMLGALALNFGRQLIS